MLWYVSDSVSGTIAGYIQHYRRAIVLGVSRDRTGYTIRRSVLTVTETPAQFSAAADRENSILARYVDRVSVRASMTEEEQDREQVSFKGCDEDNERVQTYSQI